MTTELDESTIERARQLTKRARAISDEDAAQRIRAVRDRLLDRWEYRAREREDDTGVYLILYPTAWLGDGGIDVDAIEDIDRAEEVPLERGDKERTWESIHSNNMSVATAIERKYGPVHGKTARDFGTYLSNHHLLRIEEATANEFEDFRTEYFPRNCWPSEEQAALLERSLAFVRRFLRENESTDQ